MTIYGFKERLDFSIEAVGKDCEDAIYKKLAGCVSVVKTDTDLDRSGIDYIATLRGGAEVMIDHKARDKGCSRFWTIGPELALEIWSVRPNGGRRGIAGWTLDESKLTHYTLHTYDESDSKTWYLLPFQLLRVAFRSNVKSWIVQHRTAIQQSHGWESECVFIPAVIVMDAIRDEMEGP